MNWKSTNVCYLAGIGIPLSIAAVLGAVILREKLWGVLAVAVAAVLLLRALVRKTSFMPRPRGEYRDLEPLALELPVACDVELFTCAALHRYEFVLRIAELLSPMRFQGAKPRIVVNPMLLEKNGERFMAIAVMREIERYRRKYQPATILQLALPLLSALDVVLFVLAFRIPVAAYLTPFLLQFALPFLCSLAFVGHLFFWNKRLSRRDFQLDTYLSTVFPVEDVKNYIIAVEELERKVEKKQHTALNDHYTSMRLRNLDKGETKMV